MCEVEGVRPRGRPKKTWREVTEEDCQIRQICKEDGLDHGKFRKLIMATLHSRCGYYIFALWFLLPLSSFIPRLISAVGDWMFTILPHKVWP